jgi:hypothetical protein
MIQDKRQIQINSGPERVFDVIEKMPNKFPIYKILEKKPFFFLRILLVDGLRTALGAIGMLQAQDELILKVGDSMGPFTLAESQKPFKYWFALKSFFFDCQTGYSLSSDGSITTLYFELIAENPKRKEKVWWFLFKPLHVIFAKKVLQVIKAMVENHSGEPA